jgi:hypothetical protein
MSDEKYLTKLLPLSEDVHQGTAQDGDESKISKT